MRVLHTFANFVPGGSELRAVRLINAFGDAFRHDVLSMDGRTTAIDFVDPARRDQLRLLPAPPPAGTLATVLWLRRLLRSNRPDLVLTYGWGAFDMVIAAASLGLRHVIHHEDGFNADEAIRFKRRRIWARRLVLPAIGGVIVPSRRLAAIARDLWRMPAERLWLIPNGIDAARFPAADGHAALRRQLGIPDAARVVGTVANLRPEKNLPRLVEACRAACVHLVVVGDGPERGRLAALAAEPAMAGWLHLVGHQGDPRPYLRCFDVFALSSDTEQMPLSLLEAMACGLPVVATDVGDIRAMLPPDQQPYVVARDAGSLAEALRRLDGDEAMRLGQQNKIHVEQHYSLDTMVAAYRELYCAAAYQILITTQGVEMGNKPCVKG